MELRSLEMVLICIFGGAMQDLQFTYLLCLLQKLFRIFVDVQNDFLGYHKARGNPKKTNQKNIAIQG